MENLSLDAWYENGGKFKACGGENYWAHGTLPITQSILKRNELSSKTKSDVLHKIKEQVCRPDSPWNWYLPDHRHLLIEEHLPSKTMSEHHTKIIKEMNSIYDSWKKSNLRPAKERLCIVINGESSVYKSSLARKLIVKRMAENGLVSSPDSYQLDKPE